MSLSHFYTYDESKEGLAKGRLLYNGKRTDCNKLNEILQKEYFDKGDVITTNIIKFKKTVILPIEQPQ